MLDNKGSLYIMDAVLAIFLLLIVFLVVNAAISMPSADYSYESRDIRTAQDVMELLSGKIDFGDRTFIEKISTILEDGENSKESIQEVSEISKENAFWKARGSALTRASPSARSGASPSARRKLSVHSLKIFLTRVLACLISVC